MMKETYLLIDDDEEDHEIFCTAMIRVDPLIDCYPLKSGTTAIEKLQKDTSFTPKLIFLDLDMPNMSGKQTLIELKHIPRIQVVPIIIFSTIEDDKNVEETRQLGASGYVVKPVSMNELAETLHRVVNNLSLGKEHFYLKRTPFNFNTPR